MVPFFSRTFLSLGLLATIASAQSSPAPAPNPAPVPEPKSSDGDDGARLLRRAAYYETQKGAAEKALAAYEDVVARFPDSRVALQAMERIAVLDEQAGQLDAAKHERELAAALRAKIGDPAADGSSKEPRKRGALRERIRRLLGTDRKDEPPHPPLSDLGKKVEEWKNEGLSREEIRRRIGAELKQIARKRQRDATSEPKEEGKEEPKQERREERAERRAEGRPPLPPQLQKLVEKWKAEGKSAKEIRAAIRRELEIHRRRHRREERDEREDGKQNGSKRDPREI